MMIGPNSGNDESSVVAMYEMSVLELTPVNSRKYAERSGAWSSANVHAV